MSLNDSPVDVGDDGVEDVGPRFVAGRGNPRDRRLPVASVPSDGAASGRLELVGRYGRHAESGGEPFGDLAELCCRAGSRTTPARMVRSPN